MYILRTLCVLCFTLRNSGLRRELIEACTDCTALMRACTEYLLIVLRPAYGVSSSSAWTVDQPLRLGIPFLIHDVLASGRDQGTFRADRSLLMADHGMRPPTEIQ